MVQIVPLLLLLLRPKTHDVALHPYSTYGCRHPTLSVDLFQRATAVIILAVVGLYHNLTHHRRGKQRSEKTCFTKE